MSLKISRIKNKQQCSKCAIKACMKLEDQESGKVQQLCSAHYIKYSGKQEIEHELESIKNLQNFSFWDIDLAMLVEKEFPDIKNKHGETLKKIIQSQSKRQHKGGTQ
jgi:hypothetical protein